MAAQSTQWGVLGQPERHREPLSPKTKQTKQDLLSSLIAPLPKVSALKALAIFLLQVL